MQRLVLVSELLIVKKDCLVFHFIGSYSGRRINKVMVSTRGIKNYPSKCGVPYMLYLEQREINGGILSTLLLKWKEII